jgi:hypothetical protein
MDLSPLPLLLVAALVAGVVLLIGRLTADPLAVRSRGS